MEIWKEDKLCKIDEETYMCVAFALDMFVDHVTLGWVDTMSPQKVDNICLERDLGAVRYVPTDPIPNALILFFIDVANVN